jgi:hypothetical protein
MQASSSPLLNCQHEQVSGQRSAKELKDALAAEGIMVRGCALLPALRTCQCSVPVSAALPMHQYQPGGLRSAVLVQVRHYAKASLSNYIRVSVGKPEHTDALEAVLQRV